MATHVGFERGEEAAAGAREDAQVQVNHAGGLRRDATRQRMATHADLARGLGGDGRGGANRGLLGVAQPPMEKRACGKVEAMGRMEQW
jgi:hypothetical protein